MAKKKKTSIKSEYKQREKEFVVITKYPKDYKIVDMRSMKPRCYIDIKDSDKCMVLQEIDEIQFNTKINGEKNILSYYNGSEEIRNKSVIVYDFIEAIQTSIVFGYTAIEAFTNLSINSEYKYESDISNKGIIEIYGKEAIERWLPLSIKISNILVDIYKCKRIGNEKIWTKFKEFEKYRDEIIHQKSIDSTNFYKKYFKKNIFEVCAVPEKIIKFFFDERGDKSSTNIL